MPLDAATKSLVNDLLREGKSLGAEGTAADFTLVPSEQRTRAAAAMNELQAAEKDDAEPAYPVAALLHPLDADGNPTRAAWTDVLAALSQAVQNEVDKPGSSVTKPVADPEAGIRRAVAAAEELRRGVSGACDAFKLHKKVHEALRAALFADRGQPKSRAEWEIEIASIAAALRKADTKAPPELRAFLPRLDAAEKDLKAATAQTGKARVAEVTWSAGVRETTYALALALARLLAQSFTKAAPARHGRLLRAIDPKRSADRAAKATKNKDGTGGEAGAPGGATEPPAAPPAGSASGG